jgi:hypothetical protein
LSDIEYGGTVTLADMSNDERVVLAACVDAPQSLEQIVDCTHLPATTVMQCVTVLVLKNILRDLEDQTYVRV